LGGRLADTGREAPALIDFIMSKYCPVSAVLSDAGQGDALAHQAGGNQEAGRLAGSAF